MKVLLWRDGEDDKDEIAEIIAKVLQPIMASHAMGTRATAKIIELLEERAVNIRKEGVPSGTLIIEQEGQETKEVDL